MSISGCRAHNPKGVSSNLAPATNDIWDGYQCVSMDIRPVIRENAGTGRQARLRCVCPRRTGSSPVSRTNYIAEN